MTRTLCSLALAAALMAPLGAMADEPAPLTAVSAAWVEDGKVELKLTYEGGACEATGTAEVAAGDETTDEVTIPTVSTAEVCTMQIVPVEFSGVIAVEPTTTTLAIMVLDPDGKPKAAGSVEIEKTAAN
jgi:hypothetical protein